MAPQRPIDDVALGVLLTRMDDMHDDVHGLRNDVRELITALPQQYVPRAELEERRRLVDERQATTDKRLDGITGGRRWALSLTVPSLLSTAALAFSAVHLAH